MRYFDKKFYKRERKINRTYEIDDDLYGELEKLTKIYEASVSDLINASIEYMIASDSVQLYEKPEGTISVKRSVLIRESNLAGIDKMKDKYGISVYRLVNIAIKMTLEEK